MKKESEALLDKIAFEETKSKVELEKKLAMEQDMIELKERVETAKITHDKNREELLMLQIKNSQLKEQNKQLDAEELTLKDSNGKLKEENEKLENENEELKRKITKVIQRIDINNLLKEIDVEEI